ncbi:cytochrome c oxidase assembly protein subunit 15 [Micrococcales bacterium KH10]|nr:cytochrome c oxidase assembly protein subunit 15 [Micrococcales bacterium KH10]
MWLNLIGQIAIIVTGGLVRLTGSGLGCSTWPMCEPGQFTPQFHEAATYHPFVEFGNRTMSGVLTLLGIFVLLAVWTDRSRAQSYRRWGLVPLIGVLLQAVIGGITVLIELHPAVVGFHMLISVALVAASAYLVQRQSEGDGPAQHNVDGPTRTTVYALGVWLIPVIVLGVLVTGSGPHSGDEEIGYRFALDPAAMARVHAMSVWVFIALLLVATLMLLRRTHSAPALLRRRITWLWALVLLEGVVGYVQYFTGLPAGLVAVHMLLAATLTAVGTLAVTATRSRV